MPTMFHGKSSLVVPFEPDRNGKARLVDIPMGCELEKIEETSEPNVWKMSVTISGLGPQIVFIDPEDLEEGSGVRPGLLPPVAELIEDSAPTAPSSESSPSVPDTPQGIDDTDPLSVSQGQVTFDAEGHDDPRSRFFSRVIHWPGTSKSGVTLGRSYDMGSRSSQEITDDLEQAGMAPEEAVQFAQGAEKKGEDARRFVEGNRDRLGEITHLVQKNLFELIYPRYVERGRQNYERWTANEPDRTEWEALHAAIRDILVDFVYQGFSKGPRPMHKGMHNDFDELIDYITTNDVMKRYEPGRQRARYLEATKRGLG